MSILPLQQFEADLKADLEAKVVQEEQPKTLVVKFGSMGLVAEYAYTGDVTPGCGSKLVARTHRGTELATMLTSTCPNAGCGSSVSRQEMLEYIDRSGGRDYPFHNQGRVMRVATTDDMSKWSDLESTKHELLQQALAIAEPMQLDLKLVEVEPILGGEKITIYFLAEHRIDFRDLVRELSNHFRTRIEMRQIGARDEARLTADYERCGQYCCCKNFLKVLKPVSMRSAKTQKATLDPLKISGRCGRLMCCLRYEDETYETLRKKLPNRKSRVGTPDGAGIVMDTQILTQLVQVKLEDENRIIAVPVEDLCDPDNIPPKPKPEPIVPIVELLDDKPKKSSTQRRRRRKKQPGSPSGSSSADTQQSSSDSASSQGDGASQEAKPARRRRRSNRNKPRDSQDTGKPQDQSPPSGEPGKQEENKPARKRRRRRGRGRGRGPSSGDNPSNNDSPPPADPS